MSNMLKGAMGWLAGKMKKYAGEDITYSRGAQSASITATPGKTLLALDDGQSARVEWTDADFLFPAADLVLGGVQTLPQRGDRIRWTVGGTAYVFEVMAPGTEPVWRWSDEFHTVLRVHAKAVGRG